MAEVSKISLIARNRPVFLADGPGYLLYLYDVDENINQHYTKWLILKMEYP